jgi:hypothetical protein
VGHENFYQIAIKSLFWPKCWIASYNTQEAKCWLYNLLGIFHTMEWPLLSFNKFWFSQHQAEDFFIKNKSYWNVSLMCEPIKNVGGNVVFVSFAILEHRRIAAV